MILEWALGFQFWILRFRLGGWIREIEFGIWELDCGFTDGQFPLQSCTTNLRLLVRQPPLSCLLSVLDGVQMPAQCVLLAILLCLNLRRDGLLPLVDEFRALGDVLLLKR